MTETPGSYGQPPSSRLDRIEAILSDMATQQAANTQAIAGKMGETTSDGFVLLEPNIQVFERKPKAEAAAAT